MPEYPNGTYVEEIAPGPPPIEDAATSTAAFLGETERGPTRPSLVTSYAEYLQLFGGGPYLPGAVKAFFDNGGRRLYIARVGTGIEGEAPGPTHFEGRNDDPAACTGLAALESDQYREIMIVAAPGQHDPAIAGTLVRHCEFNRFRFAVLDSPPGRTAEEALDARAVFEESSYAAYYYPWIIVSDARTGDSVSIPPSGAVCGIYALTDETRGFWKAPANETVRGALGLDDQLTLAQQEEFPRKGINYIRRFPGRGSRVWGARTLSSDPPWKYVNVRRLFIFLEASIGRSTRWVAVEANTPKLWAQLKQAITIFLRRQWRQGALFGEKEEEAFTVTVGRETMTEDDIRNGRLVIEIGVAPVRAGGFVTFRIYQQTSEAIK